MDAHGKVVTCCQLGVYLRSTNTVIATLCLSVSKFHLKTPEKNQPPLLFLQFWLE